MQFTGIPGTLVTPSPAVTAVNNAVDLFQERSAAALNILKAANIHGIKDDIVTNLETLYKTCTPDNPISDHVINKAETVVGMRIHALHSETLALNNVLCVIIDALITKYPENQVVKTFSEKHKVIKLMTSIDERLDCLRELREDIGNFKKVQGMQEKINEVLTKAAQLNICNSATESLKTIHPGFFLTGSGFIEKLIAGVEADIRKEEESVEALKNAKRLLENQLIAVNSLHGCVFDYKSLCAEFGISTDQPASVQLARVEVMRQALSNFNRHQRLATEAKHKLHIATTQKDYFDAWTKTTDTVTKSRALLVATQQRNKIIKSTSAYLEKALNAYPKCILLNRISAAWSHTGDFVTTEEFMKSAQRIRSDIDRVLENHIELEPIRLMINEADVNGVISSDLTLLKNFMDMVKIDWDDRLPCEVIQAAMENVYSQLNLMKQNYGSSIECFDSLTEFETVVTQGVGIEEFAETILEEVKLTIDGEFTALVDTVTSMASFYPQSQYIRDVCTSVAVIDTIPEYNGKMHAIQTLMSEIGEFLTSKLDDFDVRPLLSEVDAKGLSTPEVEAIRKIADGKYVYEAAEIPEETLVHLVSKIRRQLLILTHELSRINFVRVVPTQSGGTMDRRISRFTVPTKVFPRGQHIGIQESVESFMAKLQTGEYRIS